MIVEANCARCDCDVEFEVFGFTVEQEREAEFVHAAVHCPACAEIYQSLNEAETKGERECSYAQEERAYAA